MKSGPAPGGITLATPAPAPGGSVSHFYGLPEPKGPPMTLGPRPASPALSQPTAAPVPKAQQFAAPQTALQPSLPAPQQRAAAPGAAWLEVGAILASIQAFLQWAQNVPQSYLEEALARSEHNGRACQRSILWGLIRRPRPRGPGLGAGAPPTEGAVWHVVHVVDDLVLWGLQQHYARLWAAGVVLDKHFGAHIRAWQTATDSLLSLPAGVRILCMLVDGHP